MTHERRVSRCLRDPDLFMVSDVSDDSDVEIVTEPAAADTSSAPESRVTDEKEKSAPKKSVVLCLGAASTMGVVSSLMQSYQTL